MVSLRRRGEGELMSVVMLRNNLEEDGPLVPPEHEDGRPYRYCMYLNSFVDVVFADEQDELLDVLIPGYGEMTEEDQAFHRIRLAQNAAAQVQADIIASIQLEPQSDGSFVGKTEDGAEINISAEQWTTLMTPRMLAQPRADWWTCPVPLVVVETAYEPFTTVPRPASGLYDGLASPDNLWWVRPAEDEDFLISLHEIGYVRWMENAEYPVI
jgi:hypothetical protein